MNLSPGHYLAYRVPNGTAHRRAKQQEPDRTPHIVVMSQNHDGDDDGEWSFVIEGHEFGWQEPEPAIELHIRGGSFTAFQQAPDLLAVLTATDHGEPVLSTLWEVEAVLQRFGAVKLDEIAPAPADAWTPRKGDAVLWNGHGGWIVWAVEDQGAVWVYPSGTPMTSAPSRSGQTVPGHRELAHVTELRPATRVDMPPPTHRYCGSNPERESVGDPGHCEPCARWGHIVAHPGWGCGDVGCYSRHDEPDVPDLSLLLEGALLLLGGERRAISAETFRRALHVGFAKAGTLLDRLEDYGIVGPPSGSPKLKLREILPPADADRHAVLAEIERRAYDDARKAAQ